MIALTVNPKKKDSIQFKELSIPVPDLDEVVIKMVAAALNHRDLYVNGEWKAAEEWDELVAGGDGAGVIVQLGDNVTDWNIGDEVMVNPLLGNEEPGVFPGFLGGPNNGTFAQYIKVSSQFLLKKPTYLSFQEAAATPLALSTAWGTVVTKGEIKKGETVLIQGIGSGVALFNLQLALAKGAVVYVTSSSDEKLKRAIELGALTGINYRKEDVAKEISKLTNGNGVDVVIDSSGQDSLQSSIKSLSKNGRLLIFGSTTGPVKKDWLENVQHTLTGMVSQKELEEAVKYYENNNLKPILSDSIYSFKNIKEAYKELKEAKQFGKIVVMIDEK